jgi:hypothetical protein
MKLSLVKFALLVCTLYATISLALMVPAVDTSVKACGIEVRDADFLRSRLGNLYPTFIVQMGVPTLMIVTTGV